MLFVFPANLLIIYSLQNPLGVTVRRSTFASAIVSSLPVFLWGLVLGPSSSCFGEEWPEFRGPSQNGSSSIGNLPTQWDETSNVLWFSKTKGLGWSSPVVDNDRIYITSSVNIDQEASESGELQGLQQLNLVCLNAKNGEQIYSKVVFEQLNDAPKIHNKNSHASPTPVLTGNRIYVHFGHQGTACLDLEGNLVWENRDHAYPPTHGNGGSPILVDNLLILTCDGGEDPYTLALNATTGKEVWKTQRAVEGDRKFSFCTPQLIEVSGRKLVISPGSNVVQAISPADGSVEWFVSYDGFSVIPRPLFHEGTLYVCTGFMSTKLLAIDPTGTGDVTNSHVKWVYGSGVPQTPSINALGNQIVMVSDNGIATSVSTESGKELWRKRLGGNYSASPLLSGNRIYFQSELGESTVFELNETPKEIARNKLPGRIFASYAVVGNDLIIRSEQGVYRIGRP